MSTKPAVKTTAKNKPAATTAAIPAASKPVAAKPVAKAPATRAAVKKPATAPLKKAAAATKPVSKPATPADKPKTAKIKMERDSFTIPKDEYAQIAILKKRLEALGKPVKKSELLRAGLKLLAAMNDNALQAAVIAVPIIKTGRPKK